jgi:hypothetical protein
VGYCTRYDLDVAIVDVKTGNPHPSPAVQAKLQEGMESLVSELKEISGYDYPFGDDIKWYEHEDHMRAISEKYPEVLFTLSGEGEESGDIWKKYFLNGKMQKAIARIVIPEFDFNSLQ